MKQHRFSRMLTACVLAMALLCAAPMGAMASVQDASGAYADELDELSNKLAKLKKDKEALQKQISSTATDMAKKMGERSMQEQQIELISQEITLLGERITVLKGEIDVKLLDIQAKEKEINFNFEQYKKRLRASYLAGESSALSMVLGSTDFTDFLMRSEFVSATARHDKEMLAELRAEREALEAVKAQLEGDKATMEQDVTELESRKKEQEAAVANIADAIQDIALEQANYQKNKAQVDKEMAAVQAETAAIYERLKPQMSAEYVGGEFAWPLPGHYKLTSDYAASDRSDNHTGTDIAGGSAYGAKIVAANDGKVIFSDSKTTGYGKYVIVDHGGGYSTLYAHMSAISVSVGDSVARGVTQIGAVGSTGWATGPHLHFEVRINGKSTNPMAYLKG